MPMYGLFLCMVCRKDGLFLSIVCRKDGLCL